MPLSVSATLKDAINQPIPNGQLRVILGGYGALIPRVAGTNIIASTAPVIVIADGAGVATFTPTGNDVILPAGTFYTVQVLDAQQNVVQSNDYQFTGGAALNLSNLAPYNPPPQTYISPTGIVPILTSRTILNPTAGQVLASVIPQRTNPNAFYEVVASGVFTISAAPGSPGIALYATTVGGVKFGAGMNINPVFLIGRPFIIKMRFASVPNSYWSGEVEGDGSTAAVFSAAWGGPIADANNIASFTLEADQAFTGSVLIYHLVPRVTW